VAGIRFGYPQSAWPAGLSFSPDSAWNTFVQLYKIALIMALGVTLSETVPHAEFRRALDYVLTRLPLLKRYAQPLSLAAELLLKFIPIIIGEVSRLTMAVKARRPFRQRGARKPIRPSELPALFVPLLLSVMQRADDLSTAMEHRGFSPSQANDVSQTNLQFRRADYAAILIGVIWLFGCIFFSSLPKC
jgi:energy-coupling factor transport system ATP-binding protein